MLLKRIFRRYNRCIHKIKQKVGLCNNCNQRKTTRTKHILRCGCSMLYYTACVDFSVHGLFNPLY